MVILSAVIKNQTACFFPSNMRAFPMTILEVKTNSLCAYRFILKYVNWLSNKWTYILKCNPTQVSSQLKPGELFILILQGEKGEKGDEGTPVSIMCSSFSL